MSLPTQDLKFYYKKNYTAFTVCRLVNQSIKFVDTKTDLFHFYRDVISQIDSIYNMKTNIAKVQYPEALAEKIKKMFKYNETLFANALEQV